MYMRSNISKKSEVAFAHMGYLVKPENLSVAYYTRNIRRDLAQSGRSPNLLITDEKIERK